ncbi:MAG: acetylornithine aminotransferase [Crocinitomicaceae bacterium]|nr:acetylornithine aminotransferase [Crocinitomicaceae bacterium]
MYFSVNGKSDAFIIGGCGIVVERIEHSGVTIIGGPIEQSGRLKYIDGCTDSLLIPPVKMGDPCFNALYFPKGIDQTMHTHPSMRVGIVTKGEGVCITPDEKIQLKPGTVFIIHPEGEHKFRTIDKEMVVIAYHPDSDYGPVDQFHPMINRTIVKGISANSLPEIQTK